VKLFDLAWFQANRDQLWAEAAHYEAQGESITLPESLWEAAAEVQASREIPNPFFDHLQAMYHGGPGEERRWGWVTINDVWNSLKIPIDRRASQCAKLGAAMKKLGFIKLRVRNRNGDLHGPFGTQYYQRGESDRDLTPPGTTTGPWHGGNTVVMALGNDDVDM
jgi:hypothetical protein